ncbi:OLC1v1024509C1 [Oldenlandia corymbosa var. corymbosa]|nr:OLC1v1024509C1 [Oldenlandia corymbosa var. corymbosa]
MTVTLEDVAYLLGLSIDGEPVIGVTYTTCDAVCVKYLGRGPDSGYTSGGMVKLSWLKESFSHCPEDASTEDVERHTRAYLLYLVGSTIFSTTTGNKVPVMYLPLFEDFEEAGKYAWGAAALSFLYRALGNASLKSQSTISGCLTLLQCWSYYHLNVGRPRLNHDPIHECFPFVLRWKGKQSSPTANRDVVFYRKALDSLKEIDVEWCPYTNISHTVIPPNILNSLILGRSKTMLICFDKAERHLPDRCLRQFGMNQTIPEDVPKWERKSRGVDGGIDLSLKMESELNEWLRRRLHIVEAEEDVEESEYMQWYLNITRKLVGRPIPISSEFQMMSTALRDIAFVADSLSTRGMDDEQIQAVARIRYVAHECLRDQVAITVANMQPEVVKRVRGKENVRRKSMGKRKRKEDENYSSPRLNSMAGRLLSYHHNTENEIHSVTYAIRRETDDDVLASPADVKVDDEDFCETNEVDDSHFRRVAQEKGDDIGEPKEEVDISAPERPYTATEAVQQSPLENSEDIARQVEAR